MLGSIGLVAAGFGLGVVLTALVAVYFYGLLHREVARIVDDCAGDFGLFGLAYRREVAGDGLPDDDAF